MSVSLPISKNHGSNGLGFPMISQVCLTADFSGVKSGHSVSYRSHSHDTLLQDIFGNRHEL